MKVTALPTLRFPRQLPHRTQSDAAPVTTAKGTNMIGSDTAGTVSVHVVAWGLTDHHAQTAVQSAQRGRFRWGWNFARVDRTTEGACPIDVNDPKVIAADCGSGWAYAVYPAESDS